MDDRFPETIEDGELELLLKELRLAGEDPVWKPYPRITGEFAKLDDYSDGDMVLRFRDRDARLYRRENGVWVKKSRTSLGMMLASHILEELKRPSMFGQLMEALEVEPVVEAVNLIGEDE